MNAVPPVLPLAEDPHFPGRPSLIFTSPGLSPPRPGLHHSKCGNTREGAALFYRLERLACLGTFDFEMREAFDRKDNPFKVTFTDITWF